MLLLRDLPKYGTLLEYAKRYRNVNPGATEAYLSLLRVASDVLDALEEYYAMRGCSQGRFTVLALLNRNPDIPLNPADLADRSGVTRATMTGLLQGLESEGFIKRTHCSDDKRMSWVQLTARGRKHLDSILPDLFKRVCLLMAVINEKEQKTLLEILNKISERIGVMTEDEPARKAA